jgi:D-alanyl-lipoteichoic acid acyltransferase DltB (MBOAT superfamily)
MLFNSWQFALFFPTVAVLYFLAPYHWRWVLLLVASYFFYMCSVPAYGLLLLASTVIDYGLSLAIARTTSRRARIMYLLTSIVANLGMLFVFKYFNFFAGSFEVLGKWFGLSLEVPYSNLVLPIGISFYTFQTLSYTIDIFQGKEPPERHFGRYALYVAFFPQLVAGPIERSSNLLPQFQQNLDFDYERVTSGLKLMAWGLFKKMVIADHLAVLVNSVFNAPEGLSGVHFTVATIFFAFQIYCDFSGYSDIAVGAARVLGYRLMINFDRPYLARSIADFWSRWHISLSTWFRDYLYIPLGGNRVAWPRWYLNLLIVFLVSGLWHGAQWTFVMWGALHGFYLVFGLATRSVRQQVARAVRLDRMPALHVCLQSVAVFLLVCFAWIFFRANSVSDAFYIVSQLPVGWEHVGNMSWLREARSQIGISEKYLAGSLALILLLHIVEALPPWRVGPWPQMFASRFWIVRWALYAAVVLGLINLGAPEVEPFIYFQF